MLSSMLNKLRKLLFSGDKKPATRHPLSTLTIIENILEPGSWITFETPDVLTSLQVRLRLQEWPHSLRLYRMAWSRDRDVTPYTSEQAQNILNTPGHYYAVIHPAEATTWALVAVAVIALLGIAATVFLRPTIPTAANRNSQSGGSSNNALAGRENGPGLGNGYLIFSARLDPIRTSSAGTPGLSSWITRRWKSF